MEKPYFNMQDLSFAHRSYGLVVCGGKSSRMGMDKSLLQYHAAPQRYHLYDMLSPFCEETFISCNHIQSKKIFPAYNTMVDLPCYNNTGPIAALLTAFKLFTNNGFLVMGCDYPFLSAKDIREFTGFCRGNNTAAAFYNASFEMYEPLLAWYPPDAADILFEMYAAKQYSLQHYLRTVNARKFYPADPKSIQSVDTKEDYCSIKKLIKN